MPRLQNKNIWCLAIILLISINFVSAFTINEINYNPESYDNNQEYIEIYLENPTDITDYIVEDLESQDSLVLLKYNENSNYALIVEEGFDYSNLDCSVYSAGATIGGDLNNEEDIIFIKDLNSTILDTIHYFSEWGADGNGFSLCKKPNQNGLWQECVPTPCQPNSETLQNHNIIINEFLPDPKGNDNAPMPGGEYIELLNKEDFDINLEGFYLKDSTNHKITISDTTTLETTEIKANSYLIVYANGYSGFLNNDGLEKIQLFDLNNILLDEISYSDSEEDVSWALIKGIWQKTKPSPNEDNPLPEEVNAAKLEIEKVYLGNDNKAKFGDLIRIKVFINKGNETKEAVELYLQNEKEEKISKVTKVSVENKYMDYTLTLPIQIFPNCNLKYPEGEYEIILEGLNLDDQEEIYISGITENLCEEVSKKCPTVECESSDSASLELEPESLLNNELTEITGSLIYESKEIKTKKSAVYFFSLLLLLVTIQKSVEKWKK